MSYVRRSAVTVVGACLVLGGIVLMPLPGPGILVVIAGLAVLATEYLWARRLLQRAKKEAERAQEEAVASRTRIGITVLSALAMCALGITMLVVHEPHWPFLESLLGWIWSTTTGSVIIVTSLIPLVTTFVSVRGTGPPQQGREIPSTSS